MLYMDADKGTSDGATQSGQQPGNSTLTGGGQQSQMVQMSQADFDRIIGERVTRAKSSTSEDLLKALGVETPDQAKELITLAQQAKESQMSEVQKWQAKAEQAAAVAAQAVKDKEQAELLRQQTLLQYAVMQEAMKPDYGLNPQALADVWTLIDKTEITLDETGKTAGVDKALKTLVQTKPYLANGNGAKSPGTPLRQRAIVTPSPASRPVPTISKL